MAYYLRAFCPSSSVPPLADVFEWVGRHGVPVQLDPDWLDEVDVLEPDWSEAAVTYEADRRPFFLSVDSEREGDEESVLREEIEEFLEILDDVGDTADRRRVVTHLENTHAIISTRLLTDVDEAGLRAAGLLLSYFVREHGAMLQADGEGFYDGERLLVELP